MSVEITIPEESIPEEAYPTDVQVRLQCKHYEEILTESFVFVKRFNTFENSVERGNDWNKILTLAKHVYIDYLILCKKHKAISLVYLMRQMVKRYPESGVTWYSLAVALILVEESFAKQKELSECLAKAESYCCEYITRDAEGNLILNMLGQ